MFSALSYNKQSNFLPVLTFLNVPQKNLKMEPTLVISESGGGYIVRW